jgi:hypothetical protein
MSFRHGNCASIWQGRFANLVGRFANRPYSTCEPPNQRVYNAIALSCENPGPLSVSIDAAWGLDIFSSGNPRCAHFLNPICFEDDDAYADGKHSRVGWALPTTGFGHFSIWWAVPTLRWASCASHQRVRVRLALRSEGGFTPAKSVPAPEPTSLPVARSAVPVQSATALRCSRRCDPGSHSRCCGRS